MGKLKKGFSSEQQQNVAVATEQQATKQKLANVTGLSEWFN